MKKRLCKKIILTTLITSLMTTGIIPSGIKIKEANAAIKFPTWKKLEDKPNLRFAVLSDVHAGPTKLTENRRLMNVFSSIYQLDPSMDAVSIVGDFTDSGSQIEYNTFKSIVQLSKKPETNLIISMGNHEGNTADRFKNTTGKNPRENISIKGYHFITLSPRSEDTVYGGNRYNLDEEWLRKQLENATAEDPSKPIFLFMHHGIKDTAYGTDEWNTPDLGGLLKDYPQVLIFSGHSHYPLNDPRSIYQKDFTSINTSTNSYFELEEGMMYGTIPPNAQNASQIMVLDVDGTKVKIRKLDLLSGKYIGEDWVIDTAQGKDGFKYTSDRAEKSSVPYFTEGSSIKVNSVNKNGCTLTIEQGKVNNILGDNNDEIVHSYKYDFINKATGKLEKSYKIWSEFYFLPMSKTLTQSFSGLKEGVEYEVVVTAFNSYMKESSNVLTSYFKTTGGVISKLDDNLYTEIE
ncbi:MAG: metallophosphoesterase family protein, partial [Clostridium sp.]